MRARRYNFVQITSGYQVRDFQWLSCPFSNFMKKMKIQLVLVILSNLLIVSHGEERDQAINQLTNKVNEMQVRIRMCTYIKLSM